MSLRHKRVNRGVLQSNTPVDAMSNASAVSRIDKTTPQVGRNRRASLTAWGYLD